MSAPSRPSRPAARYRPGKAPIAAAGGVGDDYDSDDQSASSSSPDDARQGGQPESISDFSSNARSIPSHAGPSKRTAGVVISIGSASTGTTSVKQEPEYDSDEYETDTDEDVPDQKPVFARPGGTTTAAAAKKESESEYETDSGSEGDESESEEEEEQKPMFKPMFISRKQREQGQNGDKESESSDRATKKKKTAEELSAEAEAKAEAEAQARKREAQKLASDRIKLELLEKQAEEKKPDLDDTDGLDPEGEFQAWRLRELSRIKRTLEAEIAKEQEEAERAKRDAMTESERLALDTRLADETRAKKAEERKDSANQPGFLQKYYHKGAFFQDLDILKKRDYSQATQDAVDLKSLPSVMQVKDFGKRGRSKWTHLANEDTSKTAISLKGRSGPSYSSGQQQEGCFQCGADDHLKRDCPQLASQQDDPHKRRRVDDHRSRDSGWSGRQQQRHDPDRPQSRR